MSGIEQRPHVADLRTALRDAQRGIDFALERLAAGDHDLVLDLADIAHRRLGDAVGRARWLHDYERDGT
jgi:hypothetical protein